MDIVLDYDKMMALRKEELVHANHALEDYAERFFRSNNLGITRKWMPIVRLLCDVLMRQEAVESACNGERDYDGAVANEFIGLTERVKALEAGIGVVPQSIVSDLCERVAALEAKPPKGKRGRPKGSKTKPKPETTTA